MMVLALVALLLLRSLAMADVLLAPSPAVRPTYRDVSLKVIDAEPSYPFKWFRDHTATQMERDAMEETLVGVALPEAIRYGRTVPGCSGAVSTAFDNLSKITSKLGPVYEGNALLPGGRWFVSLSGRHYHFEQHALRACRKCSLGAANSCGSSPLMTPDLQDLLDIRVEGGRCVAGADFEPPTPTEEYDTARGGVGVVASAGRQSPLDSHQMGLLNDTMAKHSMVSNFRWGTGAKPRPDIVAKTHLALEATASDEKEHHFLSMKAFSGAVDPGWSADQVCQWARLQDRYHMQWMESVAVGDWGHSREAENDHQLSHICMGLRDARLLVRFSCEPDQISECPAQTCEQALTALR